MKFQSVAEGLDCTFTSFIHSRTASERDHIRVFEIRSSVLTSKRGCELPASWLPAMCARLSKLLRVFGRSPTHLSIPSNQLQFVTMAAEANDKTTECEPLPKLSPYEFRQYNRIAEHMDYFVSLATRAH
jgi:hypothetical protein